MFWNSVPHTEEFFLKIEYEEKLIHDQLMPLYLFYVLAAPKWVLKDIKTLQRYFLWGCNNNNNR